MESIPLIIFGVVILLVLIRLALQKLGSDFLGSVDSWTAYFRGPGMLQLVFLVIGGLGAGASVYYAPHIRNRAVVGQLKEYHVDPSKAVLQQEDIHSYSYLTVYARVIEPQDGFADLTIYRSDANGQDRQALTDITDDAWSRVDLPNPTYTNMGLIVAPPGKADAVKATKVDVLVYMNLKQ